uniref:Porin n=1 Tax=Marinobacter nauticus TaxID=2743 RepID=A0A455WBT0_MARNT|nr:hypothetical protein YBY_20140 [Marinobacter nauticus]
MLLNLAIPAAGRKFFRRFSRNALAVAVTLTAFPTLTLAQANEGDRIVLSGSDILNLTVSGQINRGLLVVDDGEDTTLLNVDNNNSSSRIRFIAETKPVEGWVAGAAYETEFRLNNSASLSQLDEDVNDTSAFRNRRVEVYFSHGDLGKLWLGQGWTATEGVSENDLSGTSVAGYSDVTVLGGGILFRDKATNTLTGTDLGDVAANLDGFGRNTRLRYDTPTFNGLQFRTSVINDGALDAGLWYNGQHDRLKVAAGLGWGNTSELSATPTYDDQLSGSLSVLDASGVSVTLAAGQADAIDSSKDDLKFTYVKLGYQASWFPNVGKTALSVDWQQTDDKDQNGDTVDVIGAQAVQKIDVIGTEVYGSVRSVSLDRNGVDYEDNLLALVGARIRF